MFPCENLLIRKRQIFAEAIRPQKNEHKRA